MSEIALRPLGIEVVVGADLSIRIETDSRGCPSRVREIIYRIGLGIEAERRVALDLPVEVLERAGLAVERARWRLEHPIRYTCPVHGYYDADELAGEVHGYGCCPRCDADAVPSAIESC